jgi:hypothetical protein
MVKFAHSTFATVPNQRILKSVNQLMILPKILDCLIMWLCNEEKQTQRNEEMLSKCCAPRVQIQVPKHASINVLVKEGERVTEVQPTRMQGIMIHYVPLALARTVSCARLCQAICVTMWSGHALALLGFVVAQRMLPVHLRKYAYVDEPAFLGVL